MHDHRRLYLLFFLDWFFGKSHDTMHTTYTAIESLRFCFMLKIWLCSCATKKACMAHTYLFFWFSGCMPCTFPLEENPALFNHSSHRHTCNVWGSKYTFFFFGEDGFQVYIFQGLLAHRESPASRISSPEGPSRYTNSPRQ